MKHLDSHPLANACSISNKQPKYTKIPRAMKICFVSSLHPALDKRVHYKEAVTLARSGHEVFHITPNPKVPDVVDNVRIIGFTAKRGVIDRLRQLRRIYNLAAAVRADCYHCNELDSWLIGVCLKLRTRAKIVFDVHEIYSHQFAESRFPRPMRPLVVLTIKMLCRMLLPFTDRLVLAKESASLDFKGSKVPQVLVQNFVDLEATDIDERHSGQDPITDLIRVLHLGAINRKRGWPQLLDAFDKLPDHNIELSVVGRFGDQSLPAFNQRVTDLGLQEQITYTSWIPYEDVPGVLREAHIGIIAFQPVYTNFIHALPHKLFDYMLAGLPVIVPSYAVEVARIVRDAEAGVTIDATDPDLIAEAIMELASNAELRERYGNNGRQAVLDRYNWQAEAARLLEMYQDLEVTHH